MKKTLITVAAAASATVMQNEGICSPFLERMLGIGIEKIVYLEREKDCRSTRLRTCAPNTRGCR